MRVEVAEIGVEVGALIVDRGGETIVVVDPGLSRREQVQRVCALVTDSEFAELCSPFPLLTCAAYPSGFTAGVAAWG